MQKKRTYAKYTREAVLLLGKQIKLNRKQRKWSEQNLADRAGISRATLKKIERGEMSPSIGLFFEAATLVGVNLFEQDKMPLSISIKHANDTLTLLPKRIQAKTQVVDDDF